MITYSASGNTNKIWAFKLDGLGYLCLKKKICGSIAALQINQYVGEKKMYNSPKQGYATVSITDWWTDEHEHSKTSYAAEEIL